MPPKKTDGAAAPKSKSTHASYQDMITDAIVALKDRNGSSRPSLKKYVKANNNLSVTDAMFDSLFNKALRTGVEKGVFEQPKGASGGTKLAKKTAKPAAPKTAKKPAVKKETKEKKATATKAKKPAATKAAKDKKPAAPKAAKKAAAPKKAPAVVDKPKTLTKTKSGRVAKTTAAPAKKAAPKKAAPKKAATKA